MQLSDFDKRASFHIPFLVFSKSAQFSVSSHVFSPVAPGHLGTELSWLGTNTYSSALTECYCFLHVSGAEEKLLPLLGKDLVAAMGETEVIGDAFSQDSLIPTLVIFK